MKLKLKTIGGQKAIIEVEAKLLADNFEQFQTGRKEASKEMVEFTTQDIVDRYNIKALMSVDGKDFMTYNNFDLMAVLDEFESKYLKKAKTKKPKK